MDRPGVPEEDGLGLNGPVKQGGIVKDRYPEEVMNTSWDDEDDGTMPENVATLAEAVVGHKIVSVERKAHVPQQAARYSWMDDKGFLITLDNGRRVYLVDTDDCCAYTKLKDFLLNPEAVDHIITGVGTTDKYQTWHIFADMADVLKLDVEWSCGNAFYYGYGFKITVVEDPEAW